MRSYVQIVVCLLAVAIGASVNAVPSDKKQDSGAGPTHDSHNLVVVVDEAANDKAKADEAPAEKSKNDVDLVNKTADLGKYTLWLFLVTGAIALIAAGQFEMFRRQLGALRRTADQADEALLVVNRPWLSVSIGRPEQIEVVSRDLHVGYSIAVKNVGKTPATNIKSLIFAMPDSIDPDNFQKFVKAQIPQRLMGFDKNFLLRSDSFAINGTAVVNEGPRFSQRGINLFVLVSYYPTFGKSPTECRTAKLFSLVDGRSEKDKEITPDLTPGMSVQQLDDHLRHYAY